MKVIIVVSLLVPLALGEKRINLEDIDKENHQGDHGNSPVSKQSDQGAGLGRYTFITNHVDYNGHSGDTGDNDDTYRVNEKSPPGKSQSTHGYDYIPQIRLVPKIVKQIHYQGGQFYELPRAADDQDQGIQQKGVKYLKQGHNGPTSEFLTYSPNLWANQGKNLGLLRHISTQDIKKVPTAVYIPNYVSQLNYPNYQSAIDPHPEAVIPFKELTQPQMEYLQNQVDVNHPNGGQVYPQGQTVSYVQGQSVEPSYYDHKPKILYSIRIAKPVYHTQSDQSGEQRYLKVPNSSSVIHTSPSMNTPHYQASDSQPSRDDDHLYVQNHFSYVSQPKSLLGSYVPSHIIAAQDTARYRERPIKLESGFLPSKINFFHLHGKLKSKSIQ